jgi:hypothetical protein
LDGFFTLRITKGSLSGFGLRHDPIAAGFTSCGKLIYFVIPNEVRNLSWFWRQQKERFLGAQRASVHRERSP